MRKYDGESLTGSLPVNSALAAAVVIAVASACAPLDRRPPLRAYQSGLARTISAVAHAREGRGEFRAGWSRVQIDLPAGVPLAGYGDRDGAPSTGTADPVYARAFAIGAGPSKRSIVLVLTADILLSSPRVADAVRAQLRSLLSPEAVFFTASHTHSGPGGYIGGFIWELVFGPYDQRAFDAVVRAQITAGREAIASMAPARIGSAELDVPGLSINRVERDGPTDPRLFVLALEHTGSNEKAALWSFGCHAVTLPAENRRLSADYPGTVAAAFEGGEYAVLGYAAGGVGSTNPRYERPDDSTWLTAPLIAGLRRALSIAHRSARASGGIASAQTLVEVPQPRYRIARDRMLFPALVEPILDTRRALFGAVAIDDTVLVHLPGELSGELSRDARALAAKHGIHMALFPFNGSYLGYVVPRRVYDLPEERGGELYTYETRVVSFLGPYGADWMMKLGLRLAAGVHRAAAAEARPR